MKPALWVSMVLIAAYTAMPVSLYADDPHSKQENAAKDTDEPVYALGDGVQPPRITHQVNPDYSHIRGVRVKGSVAIALIISSQGVPRDPRVVQSLDPDVDRCAVDALKQWRFAPAKKDGKAVAVKVTIEVEFHSM